MGDHTRANILYLNQQLLISVSVLQQLASFMLAPRPSLSFAGGLGRGKRNKMSTRTSSMCDGIFKGGWHKYLIVLWCLDRKNKPIIMRIKTRPTNVNVVIIYTTLVVSEKENKVGSYLYNIIPKATHSKLKFSIPGNQAMISQVKVAALLWMHFEHLISFFCGSRNHQLPPLTHAAQGTRNPTSRFHLHVYPCF